MRISMARTLAVIALVVLTGCAMLPGRARANTYTYTNSALDPTSGTCGSPGNCFFIISFAPGITLNAGDVVNLDVTFTAPFVVPGATGQSAIYGAVLDTNYFNCAEGLPSCLPLAADSSTSTETLAGYSGPPITTGSNFTESGFYVAYAYVNGPNPGFSVTGFDATFTINNSDPSPIEAVAVESQVINTPEPGSIALTLVGLGACFAGKRRLLPRSGRLA